ncbi:hypothetical protein Tco_0367897 [Tanacetum coccineum]
MAGLLFRMFRVDRIEARRKIQGAQVQLVMEGLRRELGMQILWHDIVVDDDVDEIPVHDLELNTTQSVSANEQNKVVNASLTAELVTYKEQVELYERRTKFELTEREQKIEEQLRIVITDRNIKEENLKKELHSVKMQLNSTINHNKSMVEEVTSLKKDFKTERKKKKQNTWKDFWT